MTRSTLCCGLAEDKSKPAADSEANLAIQRHNEIEKYLASEKELSSRTIKALMLGPPNSGKSTIMKQMRLIYCNGFSEDERRETRSIILHDLLYAFKAVLEIMAEKNGAFMTEVAKSSARIIAETDPSHLVNGSTLDAAICDSMKNVWQDPGMSDTISQTRHLFFYDSMLYFYESIDRLATPDWLPNDEDIIRARSSLAVMSAITFNIDPIIWNLITVDRYGSGIRKWMHYLEEVHCLFFVAALSDYDQHLIEDNTCNFMSEAILVFDSLIHNRWFVNKPIILFLNKFDIFKKKLAVSPISKHFPDFDGLDDDVSAAAGYFDKRFRDVDPTGLRQIYTYYTNATNTTAMKHIILSVNDVIVKKNICSLGLC